jgi:hypothetical protein
MDEMARGIDVVIIVAVVSERRADLTRETDHNGCSHQTRIDLFLLVRVLAHRRSNESLSGVARRSAVKVEICVHRHTGRRIETAGFARHLAENGVDH